MKRYLGLCLGILTATGVGAMAVPLSAAPPPGNIFEDFTAHIQRQVEVDKRSFVLASTCTQWFYERERRKPELQAPSGISFRGSSLNSGRVFRVEESIDCEAQYPGGLQAAREDFSRTQSTLSLSLTFYEFALVGDKDDDQQYSPAELQDILESFGIAFHPGVPSAFQLRTLSAHFDSIHKLGEFDALMAGMGKLYELGYRFTAHDKVALNRIMG